MVQAVIFDWYGTLAEWEHAGMSNYEAALSELGYQPDPAVVDAYHARWDGVDHRAHSTSREAYDAWTRGRLRELAGACGVVDGELERVVDALVRSEEGASMLAYPEAIPTLHALRERGLRVGVCSNWGWDLEGFLEATEVAPLLDAAVTSARVGFRKPHPGIYASILGAIGVEAPEAVFVGDSWGPDVVGPIDVGMAAVHVARDRHQAAPELPPGARRVASLDELLTMAVLEGDGPGRPGEGARRSST